VKKIFLFVSIISLLGIVFLFSVGSVLAFAEPVDYDSGPSKVSRSLDEFAAQSVGPSNTSLVTIVANVIKFVLALLGMILVVLVIYAGVLWMTAGGNVENIEKAKKLLKNSVIGLFLILGAYAISFFVIINILNIT